jgi:hypothetical protein
VRDFQMNEQLIIDYLLGNLSETEAERLDELSVINDDFAIFLETIENELIDDYIRAELPEKNRARFESYYLTTAERREKVAIARKILNHADKPESSNQFREWIRPVGLGASKVNQWVAIAAAFVLLVLGGYLLLTNIQLQNQIAQMKKEHTALKEREQQLQQDLAQRRSLDRQKETELALTRQKLEALEKQLANYHSVRIRQFAFSLMPQQREVSTIPDIKIPASAESAMVTLKLESNDFPMYKAILKNAGTDEILWQSDAEKSINQSITVKVPAKILKSQQDYILEVFGITKAGQMEIISGYPFHVVSQ